GKDEVLSELVQTWQRVEDAPARASILSGWCAEAHANSDVRARQRTLVMSLRPTVPGSIVFVSTAECEVLAEPSRAPGLVDLANAYLASATAAVDGTWLVPGSAARSDTAAAVALTLQAAYLLATFVKTPEALVRAREALVTMLDTAPDHPGLLEA